MRQRQRTYEKQPHFKTSKFAEIPRQSAFTLEQQAPDFQECYNKKTNNTECRVSREGHQTLKQSIKNDENSRNKAMGGLQSIN